MREILFRGKRADNGEWVEGNLFIPLHKCESLEVVGNIHDNPDILGMAK